MDSLLRDISRGAAEATLCIGEEEAKTGLKNQLKKAQAGARRVADAVLEHVASVADPLGHSERTSVRRFATLIKDARDSNKTKLSETQASSARQTLKEKFLRHARKASTSITIGATAARVLMSPDVAEVSDDLTPSPRGVEFATQAVVDTARASKDVGELLTELTAVAVDARSRVSTGLHRLTDSFSSSFSSPALFSPSSASSQSVLSPADSDEGTAAPPISIKDFLSPISPSVSAIPALAARKGMLTKYLRSKTASSTEAEATSAAQESLMARVDEFVRDLSARVDDNETTSALRTLAEYHLEKATDAVSTSVKTAANRISAFVRKAHVTSH